MTCPPPSDEPQSAPVGVDVGAGTQEGDGGADVVELAGHRDDLAGLAGAAAEAAVAERHGDPALGGGGGDEDRRRVLCATGPRAEQYRQRRFWAVAVDSGGDAHPARAEIDREERRRSTSRTARHVMRAPPPMVCTSVSGRTSSETPPRSNDPAVGRVVDHDGSAGRYGDTTERLGPGARRVADVAVRLAGRAKTFVRVDDGVPIPGGDLPARGRAYSCLWPWRDKADKRWARRNPAGRPGARRDP